MEEVPVFGYVATLIALIAIILMTKNIQGAGLAVNFLE